jgi:hypothetical protein
MYTETFGIENAFFDVKNKQELTLITHVFFVVVKNNDFYYLIKKN